MGRLSTAWQGLKAFASSNRVWLLAHPTSLAIVAVAGVGGAAVGVPVGDDAFTYLWADDRFCDDCHVHDWANEAFTESVHFRLTTCHDCHLVPIRHYPRNLWVTLFDPPQSPEDLHAPEVDRVICARCHSYDTDGEPLTGPMPDDLRAQVVKIDQSPLHQVHLTATSRVPSDWQGGGEPAAAGHGGDGHGAEAGGHGTADDAITCMDCHGAESNRAHQFAASQDNCVACHTALDPQQSGHDRANPVPCRSCHFEGFVGTSTATAP